jgi:hypothetical protein
MGVWHGVVMDSLKYHPGPPCPTLLRPTGGSPLKRPYGRFRGDLPTERAAVFYPFEHHSPYAYAPKRKLNLNRLSQGRAARQQRRERWGEDGWQDGTRCEGARRRRPPRGGAQEGGGGGEFGDQADQKKLGNMVVA